MYRLASLCAASLASFASAQVLEATSIWEIASGGNGHTYTLYSVKGGVNWATAEADAVARGGTLATLTSAAENQFVYTSLGIATNDNVWHVDQYNSRIGPWLGGFQPVGSPEPGGNWQWITGESFSYTNWSPGEPNNNAGNQEDRIHFFGNPSRNSLWNDIPGDALIEGYVVETVPSPAPVAAFALAGLAGLRRRR